MDKKPSLIEEFKDFIWSGDLIMIAVGLIMALYVKDVIDRFMEGIVNPIIAAIVGKPNLDQFGFDIGKARISIGLVLTGVLNLILVGAVLFAIVKAYKAYADRKKTAGVAAPTEVELLTEIRDSLRARNN